MRYATTLIALALLLPTPALAGDDGETLVMVKDTIEEIAKARKTKDGDLMGSAFVRAVELHNGLEGGTPRKKLQVAIGGVIKEKKCKAFHSEAVSTLEQLDDGDGVYKQLAPVLPKATHAEVPDLGVYAVKVVGIVRSPKGLSYLNGIATKGKHLGARAAAVEAMRHYRSVKKANVKALGYLFSLLHTLRPVMGEERKEEVQKAWVALEKPIVASLDELTYKDLKTANAWVEWHKTNKSKLKDVFKD